MTMSKLKVFQAEGTKTQAQYVDWLGAVLGWGNEEVTMKEK